MTMRPLDRIVTLQRRVVSRDSFGSEVERWDTVEDLWASVRLTGVREQYLSNANREQATRNGIFRVRVRDDISAGTHRLVYEDHAWDILGVDPEIHFRRFLDLTCETEIGGVDYVPAGFDIRGGLSDDATPVASEITLVHDRTRLTFQPFSNKHVIIWRDADEPDITAVVFEDDITSENQLAGFTKFGMTVAVGGVAGNAWVSDHPLTFTEVKVLEVA